MIFHRAGSIPMVDSLNALGTCVGSHSPTAYSTIAVKIAVFNKTKSIFRFRIKALGLQLAQAFRQTNLDPASGDFD